MPRAKLRSKVIERPQPTAILSSAANFQAKRPALPLTGQTTGSDTTIGGDTSWHADCWTYYDEIGEYRYAVNWVGNLLSRAVLYVTKDGEKVADQAVTDLLDQLFDGPEGQADMLRQLGIHWTVAGDCYLMGIHAGDDAKDDWLIGAANQTTRSNEGIWKVANETFTGVGNVLAIRMWQPHPQNRLNSDSPSHAALTVLSELDGLTKKVNADIDSRLAGAGLLLIPNEISFGAPRAPEPVADADDESATDPKPLSQPDELVRTLIEVSSLALSDQSTAAAKVPVVLQGPGENLNQIKHLTWATSLDEHAQELRTEAIRRLALSMDMPPEILTGTSDMNHWSSWQLEEAAIKAHTEPLLSAICTALTVGYLRPLIDSEDAGTYAIEADTAALRLRPNRSEEATELNDRGILTDEATARENGFDDPKDLMTPEQRGQWLLKKVAQGSTTPGLVQSALAALGVALDDPSQGSNGSQPGVGQQERPTPSLQDHPSQNPPDPNATQAQGATGALPASGAPEEDPAAALTAAAGVMVYRALERAGNRLKQDIPAKLGVPAADLYRSVVIDFNRMPVDKLLDDAWGAADFFAPRFGVPKRWLIDSLDRYTRDLIEHRKPLDYQTLRAHLSLSASGGLDA